MPAEVVGVKDVLAGLKFIDKDLQRAVSIPCEPNQPNRPNKPNEPNQLNERNKPKKPENANCVISPNWVGHIPQINKIKAIPILADNHITA